MVPGLRSPQRAGGTSLSDLIAGRRQRGEVRCVASPAGPPAPHRAAAPAAAAHPRCRLTSGCSRPATAATGGPGFPAGGPRAAEAGGRARRDGPWSSTGSPRLGTGGITVRWQGRHRPQRLGGCWGRIPRDPCMPRRPLHPCSCCRAAAAVPPGAPCAASVRRCLPLPGMERRASPRPASPPPRRRRHDGALPAALQAPGGHAHRIQLLRVLGGRGRARGG